jgi:hypothetical protein
MRLRGFRPTRVKHMHPGEHALCPTLPSQVFEQMAARDEAEMVNAQWIRTLHNEPTFRCSTRGCAARLSVPTTRIVE